MKKILIIEDEEILLELLQKKIKLEGYDVSSARDGEEGLSKMREVKPDLILLDILMPKKNGLEVLREMKEDSELSKIPVIVISNSGQPVEIDQCVELGAKDYVVKTQFDPGEIIEKIIKQLGEERGDLKNSPKE